MYYYIAFIRWTIKSIGEAKENFTLGLRNTRRRRKRATEKTSEKLADRIVCSQQLGIPNITELARMAYVDKFQFGTLVAYQSVRDVPLKLLLPFSEQVITLIGPEKRRASFTQKYGLTPEEENFLGISKSVFRCSKWTETL